MVKAEATSATTECASALLTVAPELFLAGHNGSRQAVMDGVRAPLWWSEWGVSTSGDDPGTPLTSRY